MYSSCIGMSICFAQNKNIKSTHVFFDFNMYHDSRDFKTYTLNLLAIFSERVHFFSLTNSNSSENKFEFETYYSEHHLRYKLSKNSPIELSKLWTHSSNKSNDNVKFGLRFNLKELSFTKSFFNKMGLNFYFSSHFVQFSHNERPNYIPQFEYVYHLSVLPKTLYIAGFADQNIQWADTFYIGSNWVTEHQLSYSVYKSLYFIVEYKFNNYLQKKSGIGFGVQYLAKF